jgi:hypothetical protein
MTAPLRKLPFAFSGQRPTSEMLRSALPKITPTLVIPAKLVLRESGGAGIHFARNVDPRLRGGDVLTFISLGGPPTHVHSA